MVFKKPAPPGPSFSVPQTIGLPGWIVFSYEKNVPVCMWITSRECIPLQCCVDERICSDTIFRCEKIRNDFIVSDIFMYNSNCVFACSSFKQRYDWLKDLLKFIVPLNFKLIHKSELTHHKIRGEEVYLDDIGTPGYYRDVDSNLVTVKKLAIPDCYQIGEDYLRVPDLKTSEYLRTLGSVFELSCVNNGDGSWSMVEKSNA